MSRRRPGRRLRLRQNVPMHVVSRRRTGVGVVCRGRRGRRRRAGRGRIRGTSGRPGARRCRRTRPHGRAGEDPRRSAIQPARADVRSRARTRKLRPHETSVRIRHLALRHSVRVGCGRRMRHRFVCVLSRPLLARAGVCRRSIRGHAARGGVSMPRSEDSDSSSRTSAISVCLVPWTSSRPTSTP